MNDLTSRLLAFGLVAAAIVLEGCGPGQCGDHSTCSTCTTDPFCQWCGGSCELLSSSCSSSVLDASQCGSSSGGGGSGSCSSYASCSACASQSSCSWCFSTGTCIDYSSSTSGCSNRADYSSQCGTSGGTCTRTTSSGTYCTATATTCGDGYCCGTSNPYHCAATRLCYATASAAASACGSTACYQCQ